MCYGGCDCQRCNPVDEVKNTRSKLSYKELQLQLETTKAMVNLLQRKVTKLEFIIKESQNESSINAST